MNGLTAEQYQQLKTRFAEVWDAENRRFRNKPDYDKFVTLLALQAPKLMQDLKRVHEGAEKAAAHSHS